MVLTFLTLTLVSCKSAHTSSKTTPPDKSVKSGSTEVKKKEDTRALNVEKTISTARSYIGTKYLYGGCSRNGIDCSGLVCTAFKAVNVTLPRVAGDQSKLGTAIHNISDLQPGDLIFFTDKKGNTAITHVGIVTEVKSKEEVKFIHASSKLGVVEVNLCTDYYKGIFLRGTRIL